MCGRYTLTAPWESLVRFFRVSGATPLNLPARYNIAPTQDGVAIRAGEDGARTVSPLRWGLVPSWADDIGIGNKLINARAETVAEKPSFREAFAGRRCLIAADGFYEWRLEDGRKQPFRIGFRGGKLFAFAGLWESWTAAQDGGGVAKGEQVESFTIITTSANPKIHPIHPRMPVILPEQAHDTWLAPDAAPAALQRLLRPHPPEDMAFYRVGTHVNNVRNDDAACIAPLKAA